ncbi:hypothetical protein B0H14DRAFT_3447440 [Mycena olivaceomarginata]|nr:hypothetical protein B0H14DRAFT_3447440 [Mycena olivaceomarginata]
MTEERPPSCPAATEPPSSSSPSTTEPPASSSTEEAPRQKKIQLFTHRAQGRSPPLSFPPLVSPLICMGTAMLKYDRPSTIIADLGPPYTMVERVAHRRLIMRQRADLERDAGIDRVIAQIALLLEITDWGEWQATREARLAREAEVEAARHHRRRDQKEARDRAGLEERVRPRRVPSLRLVNRRGQRTPREVTLVEDDLYLDEARPPFVTFLPRLHFICNLCHNIKSHPCRVSKSLRDNCYVCIRISLETTWECPTCEERISARPVPNDDEQRAIERDYPNWDQSRVNYAWDGLVFPTTQLP